uniref:Uncharacterized protein n=1 Tax=Arion vulgaris TaxID=1028688 RepID=A0A0B7BWD4_9EUPU
MFVHSFLLSDFNVNTYLCKQQTTNINTTQLINYQMQLYGATCAITKRHCAARVSELALTAPRLHGKTATFVWLSVC